MTKNWVEENARKFFSRNTCISLAKNDGKKSSEKSAKTRFFFINTEYRDQKWVEKTRKKNFSRNTQTSQANNNGINQLEKVRKNVFYKHTNIVTKNRGKRREKKLFQKHVYRELKTMEKKVWKSAKSRFN